MVDEKRSVPTLGSSYLGDGRCRFLVWAPLARRIEVHLLGNRERYILLTPEGSGYHRADIDGVWPGDRYRYRLDGREEYPDPASRCQPEGVLGPSEVVDGSFPWDDSGWFGPYLEKYIIYELHVGTFTAEGTFEAVIPYLDGLKETGITAIELMPVAQFPGDRNWGYDGVYPFAVQNSYGGPSGLKRLVNACHRKGLAAILDVVYNHFGPEGNFCSRYGPYFTGLCKSPWGDALNFDGPQSDEVRRFFIENALYWVTDFHFDALRLDAVHAILDYSPEPFLKKLAESIQNRARDLHRNIYVFAESDANDARLVTDRSLGGYGIDAQWSDDLHHSLHTLLTGEKTGYYQDFGKLRDLAAAIKEGFVYTGQYSTYRRRCHGSSLKGVSSGRLVVFSQNHDQIGNRAMGERLSRMVSFEALKLAAGIVLLTPSIPLLFMGEEYGETAPFPYFISHSDPGLIESVRQGRKEEFASFREIEVPDPQSKATFLSARLDHGLKSLGKHKVLADFYRELIRLRNEVPALSTLDNRNLDVISYEGPKILFFRRREKESEIFAAFNFGESGCSLFLPVPEGEWRCLIDSQDRRWAGSSPAPPELSSGGGAQVTLSPLSFVLYGR